jgi:gamma-glutamylcyclotransferase
MTTVRYFAYGSNMLRERLRARVPSAGAIGVAMLPDYRLDFAKVSTDKSGKADVVRVPGSSTYGVLFELDERELAALDRAEGADYQRDLIDVGFGDAVVKACCYFAKDSRRQVGLLPYCWYVALIKAGATQHALPETYQESFRRSSFVVDPVSDRKTRLEALAALT